MWEGLKDGFACATFLIDETPVIPQRVPGQQGRMIMLQDLWEETWYRWTGLLLGISAMLLAWGVSSYMFGFQGFLLGWIPAGVLSFIVTRAWLPVLGVSLVLAFGVYFAFMRDTGEPEIAVAAEYPSADSTMTDTTLTDTTSMDAAAENEGSEVPFDGTMTDLTTTDSPAE